MEKIWDRQKNSKHRKVFPIFEFYSQLKFLENANKNVSFGYAVDELYTNRGI